MGYDGTAFHGFASQPYQVTVVGEFADTLARSLRLRTPPDVVGAGRTDAGVHALAQVVHVDLPTRLFVDDRGPEIERLVRSLNRQLRGRVVVVRATPVDGEFHARFSATWRAYRYLVIESAEPALETTAHLAWTVEGPLDLEAMHEATSLVRGTHDFQSFCKRPAGGEPGTPLVRQVLDASWRRVRDEWTVLPAASPVYRFDIRANAFCHQMVRSLTSALIAVGQGRVPVSLVGQRLLTPLRTDMPAPAPPGGLCLIGVGYDELAGGPSGFVS